MKAVVGRDKALIAWALNGAAVVLLTLLTPVCAAQALAPADKPVADMSVPAREMAAGHRCGSVVIKHCRRRRETSSIVLDPALSGRNGAPMQWEVVQFSGPDNDDIVVNGERIRNPSVGELFEQTFGAPLGSPTMLTGRIAAGALCTTIIRSGAILCSNGGGGLPALDNPLADWTF